MPLSVLLPGPGGPGSRSRYVAVPPGRARTAATCGGRGPGPAGRHHAGPPGGPAPEAPMPRPLRPGLVLLGALSLADLAGPLTTDGDHPPMWVALVGAALGLASL